ncbi:hypothetical protein HYH03_015631 [Edaphochlamys debaryana]|uniref:Uncharacterized protein n=1 Tax=Edaphochlamys debaryana TaxID=47281 RepID=A0A835XTG5_9CHLO|nr:hypothetical protein HYH03_015631 [Edaphochlamys debaryana]|eukprot:KAG2485659.1 hypothetical protein HYH03_015631 [Edaphochlamys debaryana]
MNGIAHGTAAAAGCPASSSVGSGVPAAAAVPPAHPRSGACTAPAGGGTAPNGLLLRTQAAALSPTGGQPAAGAAAQQPAWPAGGGAAPSRPSRAWHTPVVAATVAPLPHNKEVWAAEAGLADRWPQQAQHTFQQQAQHDPLLWYDALCNAYGTSGDVSPDVRKPDVVRSRRALPPRSAPAGLAARAEGTSPRAPITASDGRGSGGDLAAPAAAPLHQRAPLQPADGSDSCQAALTLRDDGSASSDMCSQHGCGAGPVVPPPAVSAEGAQRLPWVSSWHPRHPDLGASTEALAERLSSSGAVWADEEQPGTGSEAWASGPLPPPSGAPNTAADTPRHGVGRSSFIDAETSAGDARPPLTAEAGGSGAAGSGALASGRRRRGMAPSAAPPLAPPPPQQPEFLQAVRKAPLPPAAGLPPTPRSITAWRTALLPQAAGFPPPPPPTAASPLLLAAPLTVAPQTSSQAPPPAEGPRPPPPPAPMTAATAGGSGRQPDDGRLSPVPMPQPLSAEKLSAPPRVGPGASVEGSSGMSLDGGPASSGGGGKRTCQATWAYGHVGTCHRARTAALTEEGATWAWGEVGAPAGGLAAAGAGNMEHGSST